jgi:carbon monoxide dehydrogenase subunit G
VIVRSETVVPEQLDTVWGVVSDPHRLPDWWPGVARVEEASPLAWTTVLTSGKGKSLRADYTRVSATEPTELIWRQEVEASPFERILAAATTSVLLAAEDDSTRVTIELDQKARGWARFAPFQFRAAGKRQVQGAAEGLERLFA